MSNWVYQRRVHMDAVEPSPLECRQDRSSLVCIRPSPRSTPRCVLYRLLRRSQASPLVRDLGIYLDLCVSITHVSKTVACCFAALCQIRSIQRSLSSCHYSAIVMSLILSRLETGLWQCWTSRCPWIPARLTAVSMSCCSTSDERLEQVWPR